MVIQTINRKELDREKLKKLEDFNQSLELNGDLEIKLGDCEMTSLIHIKSTDFVEFHKKIEKFILSLLLDKLKEAIDKKKKEFMNQSEEK